MTIKVEKDNKNKITIAVEGRLDLETAEEFHKCIEELPIKEDTTLELDFSKLDAITGSGIRECLMLAKRVGTNSLKITNASDSVMRTAKACGVTETLSIVPSPLLADDVTKLTIRDVISKCARENGKKVFIRYMGKKYTWDMIDKGSEVIAAKLFAAGVTKYSHVGIFSENSVNWVMCFFAIQKLGAIAVAINNKLTIAELESIFELGDITYLCYDKLPKPCSININNIHMLSGMLCISQDCDFISEFYDMPVRYDFDVIPVDPDDPAVILFTSGSTGKSRAVLLSGVSLLLAAKIDLETFAFDEETNKCITVPLSHLLGLGSGLFESLLSNSTITLPDSYHMSSILNCIKNCSFAIMVPTVLIGIFSSPDYSLTALAGLRSMLLAGAAIQADYLKSFSRQLPNVEIYMGYAMTENIQISGTHRGDSIDKLSTTVGVPCDGVSIQFCNNSEILVKGDNLRAVCYYKVLAEEQCYDADGWIHTGDMGFIDDEGYLHLTGRVKDIINRGGEKILPNEVEAALCSIEGVLDAKVFGIPDDFYGETVAAALIMKDGYILEENQLRTELRSKLAGFKIPAFIKSFESFPMLANGKTDVKALKQIMGECITRDKV